MPNLIGWLLLAAGGAVLLLQLWALRQRSGAPGHFTLRYATVPGSAQLELVYHRVWEADTPPVATFSLAVVVK